MDSTQLALITDLAYTCPSNYTTANAQAVLHLLYGTEFEECEEMVNRRSYSLIKDVVFTVPETDAWVEDNFPNPFTDETLINYYLPKESTGSIVVTDMYGREIAFFNLTNGENTFEAEQLLIATEISEGNYSEAHQLLSNISPSTQEISDWLDYNQILLSLFESGKSIYEIDSTNLSFVINQAYKCPMDYTAANAQALLELLYGLEIPGCMEMSNRSSRILVKEVDFTLPEGESFILDNFPNPFKDNVYINYYLTEEDGGIIKVMDIYGRIVDSYNLTSGENTIKISSEAWQPSVYTFGLYVNGKPVEFKKMIKTQ